MGGVILVLMGLVFFFAAFYEKSGHQTGKFRKYDGIITEADKKQKKFTVEYTVGGNTYTGVFALGKYTTKKPKAGAKVTVMIMPEVPQPPICVLLGSNSLKRQIIFIAFGAVALFLGIINLIAC